MGDFIFCLIIILVLLSGIFTILGMVFDDRFDEDKMMKLAAGTFVLALVIIVLLLFIAGIGSLII